MQELRETLPAALDELQQWLAGREWGRTVLGETSRLADRFRIDQEVLSRAAGVFSTVLGTIAGIFVVLFVGLYLAVEPGLYVRGLLHLVPAARRDRAREVLGAVGYTLRRWLLGRFATMVAVGLMTGVGLWVLGMPLALTLGLLAGLLDFIPNFGPLLAYLPAVLLALAEGPDKALYVTILYLAVQATENYLLTPLVERGVVFLPPVLTIVVQILFGILLGALGFTLASPLLAVAMVLVKLLYVEDVLGDSMEVPGTDSG